jgi:hypothetical protein
MSDLEEMIRRIVREEIAAADKARPPPLHPFPLQAPPACGVCGLPFSSGPWAYACTRRDCPHKAMAVAYSGQTSQSDTKSP